jgi:hypothetical protein
MTIFTLAVVALALLVMRTVVAAVEQAVVQQTELMARSRQAGQLVVVMVGRRRLATGRLAHRAVVGAVGPRADRELLAAQDMLILNGITRLQ